MIRHPGVDVWREVKAAKERAPTWSALWLMGGVLPGKRWRWRNPGVWAPLGA